MCYRPQMDSQELQYRRLILNFPNQNLLINTIELLTHKYNTSTTEQEFQECLSKTRSFLDEFLSDSCIFISEKKGTKKLAFDEKGKIRYSKSKPFLSQTIKILTKEESLLLDAIHQFLDTETHGLESAKINARTGINHTIEFLFLLTEKIKKL